MPRKSARLLSKSKTQSPDADAEIPRPKRRKMEEVESRECMAVEMRQQFRIQNKWLPISGTTAVASCILVPTSSAAFTGHLPLPGPAGDQENQENCEYDDNIIRSAALQGRSHFRFSNHFQHPPTQSRSCPLPLMSWADGKEVWEAMLEKEAKYPHTHHYIFKHPQLQARMRPVLFEWMMEVSEVYRLHRETLYLAMDFIDRYLQAVCDMPKTSLQLLGVTALFVASKFEEIYPPKVTDFAYVTDGACTEDDIKGYEIILSKALKWEFWPMTANSWLLLYLQLINLDCKDKSEEGMESDLKLIEPHFSANLYLQVIRLLDLCMWDMDCLQFDYSILAASALHHMGNIATLLKHTGLTWGDLVRCVQWMSPFAAVVKTMPPAQVKFFQTVKNYDAHNIQTKTVDLELYDRAIAIQAEGGACVSQMTVQPQLQPLNPCTSPQPSASLVTPPRSSRKTPDMEH